MFTPNVQSADGMWHYSKPRCFHMELVLDILYIDNTYMISHIESSNVQLAHGTHCIGGMWHYYYPAACTWSWC